MKLPITKANLAPLPAPVRDQVLRWKERHRRRFFHLYETHNFWTEEGATYTAFNVQTGQSLSATAASMLSGTGDIMPARECPLPPGNWMIEEAWPCGVPTLSLFFNPARPASLAAGLAQTNKPALENNK